MKLWMMALLLLVASKTLQAAPYIEVEHAINTRGFAFAKVINKTNRQLDCYIMVDGYKIRFRLMPNQTKGPFTTTDRRFNHTNFSVKCDYAR